MTILHCLRLAVSALEVSYWYHFYVNVHIFLTTVTCEKTIFLDNSIVKYEAIKRLRNLNSERLHDAMDAAVGYSETMHHTDCLNACNKS